MDNFSFIVSICMGISIRIKRVNVEIWWKLTLVKYGLVYSQSSRPTHYSRCFTSQIKYTCMALYTQIPFNVSPELSYMRVWIPIASTADKHIITKQYLGRFFSSMINKKWFNGVYSTLLMVLLSLNGVLLFNWCFTVLKTFYSPLLMVFYSFKDILLSSFNGVLLF